MGGDDWMEWPDSDRSFFTAGCGDAPALLGDWGGVSLPLMLPLVAASRTSSTTCASISKMASISAVWPERPSKNAITILEHRPRPIADRVLTEGTKSAWY